MTVATASSSAPSAFARRSGPGSKHVPVVIGSEAHDVYAQVAENQKRHGLTPLDLARFMRSRADAGDSNAEIAKRMGIDLTSVAHHLALLTLPPELDEAFRSGRCTSPRTLYELAKLQQDEARASQGDRRSRRRDHSQCGRSLKKAPRPPRGSDAANAAAAPSDVSCWIRRTICAHASNRSSPHDQARRPGHGGRIGGLARRLAQLGSEQVGRDRPRIRVAGSLESASAHSPCQLAAREYFTVDLRGLRAALAARAAQRRHDRVRCAAQRPARRRLAPSSSPSSSIRAAVRS